MENKIEEYIGLFFYLKERGSDEAIAISLVQEIAKDRRAIAISGKGKTSDPATEKQKALLSELNVEFPPWITKERASELIDQAIKEHRARETAKPRIQVVQSAQ